LLERVRFPAGDDHLRVALGETLRQRSPNAAASAGNQHYLIRNVE
jgi:hypothetical protein